MYTERGKAVYNKKHFNVSLVAICTFQAKQEGLKLNGFSFLPTISIYWVKTNTLHRNPQNQSLVRRLSKSKR
jgi:hypothetical protein